MAIKKNQGAAPMWPSLELASTVSNVANVFFILSLVVGVISTIVIVWMAGVKEAYWDDSRRASAERIAALSANAESSRAAIAEANARAEEAKQKANEADVARLKLEAQLSPRNIPEKNRTEFIASLKPYAGTAIHFWVFPSGTPSDTTPLADLLHALLKEAGWSPWISVSIGGQTAPGILVSSKVGSTNEPAAALVKALNEQASLGAQLVEPYASEPNFGAATTEDGPAPEFTIIIRIGAKQ